MNDIKQPVLYVLVGLPGSGKSTWCNEHVKDAMVISTDNHIEKVAREQGRDYREVFYAEIHVAIRNILDDLQYAIEHGYSIVWDQTNLDRGRREWILEKVPSTYYKIAVVFDLDDDTIAKRIKLRAEQTGKDIPEDVLANMREKKQPVLPTEKFDKIIYA